MQSENLLVELKQAFRDAAVVLSLSYREQKLALGLIEDKAPKINIEWVLSVSIDAQSRARSLIKIANGLKTISEHSNGKQSVPELVKDYFGGHNNLINWLSDYDRSEREAQISSVVATLKRL